MRTGCTLYTCRPHHHPSTSHCFLHSSSDAALHFCFGTSTIEYSGLRALVNVGRCGRLGMGGGRSTHSTRWGYISFTVPWREYQKVFRWPCSWKSNHWVCTTTVEESKHQRKKLFSLRSAASASWCLGMMNKFTSSGAPISNSSINKYHNGYVRFLLFAVVNPTQPYIANLENQLESWVSFGPSERMHGHQSPTRQCKHRSLGATQYTCVCASVYKSSATW